MGSGESREILARALELVVMVIEMEPGFRDFGFFFFFYLSFIHFSMWARVHESKHNEYTKRSDFKDPLERNETIGQFAISEKAITDSSALRCLFNISIT